METAFDYLARTHEILKEDYVFPNNEKAICGDITTDIAELLFEEEKPSKILKFCEMLSFVDGKIHYKKIIPIIYQGREWKFHEVCSLDNQIYDPMLNSNPIPLKDYCELAFGESVRYEIVATKENMGIYIEFYNLLKKTRKIGKGCSEESIQKISDIRIKLLKDKLKSIV